MEVEESIGQLSIVNTGRLFGGGELLGSVKSALLKRFEKLSACVSVHRYRRGRQTSLRMPTNQVFASPKLEFFQF